MNSHKVPIRFDAWYRVLSSAVGLLPSQSYVLIDTEEIEVRMGWAFRARFPRSAVQAVTSFDRSPLSRGVHGFGGKWLVNGSGAGIVQLDLSPRQRAYVLGIRVSLVTLLVSVGDPTALASALRHPVTMAR